MKTILLAAGAATVALSAGSALATPKTTTAAGPAQPIPYSQLNAYLKASPKQRASQDWWSTASTGASTNTSTTAATPSLSSDTAGATGANPPSAGGESKGASPDAAPSTAVNPPAATPPEAPAPATPPK